MGNNRLTKDEWGAIANARIRTFIEVARILGKAHPLTQRMGTLAWGRHSAETSTPTLASTIYIAGYLEGYYNCLNVWARDYAPEAQRVLINAWHQYQASGYQAVPDAQSS